MFANRFTILVDACSLVPALSRNILLSLAEAEFYRIRWSLKILDETERAICRTLTQRNVPNPLFHAKAARGAMESAFAEASVFGHEPLIKGLNNIPDPNDAHVIAAAVKTRASVIVTENLQDFPPDILNPLDLEAKTADALVSDIIDLDVGKAIPVFRTMRHRFNRPAMTPENLLLRMEASGFTQTLDALRGHLLSL